jgi:hypothetical protein
MSGLQAIVLLCFNDKDQLGYSDLLTLTGLSEEELNIQLISLACLEHKILLTDHSNVAWNQNLSQASKSQISLAREKSSFKKLITKDDTFTVNTGFTAKQVRIQINSI